MAKIVLENVDPREMRSQLNDLLTLISDAEDRDRERDSCHKLYMTLAQQVNKHSGVEPYADNT